MARGYPSPRREPDPVPETGLDPRVCFICKRARVAEPGQACAECARKLKE